MSSNYPTPSIVIKNLIKKYGDFVAVNDISLTVEAGKIFGFLGPNGAGKTTTIKILAGLLQQDSGDIIINGYDISKNPEKCKFSTGYIPDRPFLYEKLTGIEFLKFIASLYNLSIDVFEKNTSHLLKLFDIYEDNRKIDLSNNDNFMDHFFDENIQIPIKKQTLLRRMLMGLTSYYPIDRSSITDMPSIKDSEVIPLFQYTE